MPLVLFKSFALAQDVLSGHTTGNTVTGGTVTGTARILVVATTGGPIIVHRPAVRSRPLPNRRTEHHDGRAQGTTWSFGHVEGAKRIDMTRLVEDELVLLGVI